METGVHVLLSWGVDILVLLGRLAVGLLLVFAGWVKMWYTYCSSLWYLVCIVLVSCVLYRYCKQSLFFLPDSRLLHYMLSCEAQNALKSDHTIYK